MPWETLETFFTPNQQTMFFLYSIALGVLLSIVFDILRVIRAVFPHDSILVAMEDILFFLFWAFCVYAFSINLCRGEVRLYYFIGNVIGFSLWHFTVGNLVLKIIRKISDIIKKALKFISDRTLLPIKEYFSLECKNGKRFFVGNYLKLKKIINKDKIYLKENGKVMYNSYVHHKKKLKGKVYKRGKKNKAKKNYIFK